MAQHFAHVKNNYVDIVIVIDEETLDSQGGWHCDSCGLFAPRSEWVECSPDKAIRKIYPSKGYEYDSVHDMFFCPKPAKFPSWVKDVRNGEWKPPKPAPTLPIQAPFQWVWNEEKNDWEQKRIADRDPVERNSCLLAGNCVIDPLTNEIVDK